MVVYILCSNQRICPREPWFLITWCVILNFHLGMTLHKSRRAHFSEHFSAVLRRTDKWRTARVLIMLKHCTASFSVQNCSLFPRPSKKNHGSLFLVFQIRLQLYCSTSGSVRSLWDLADQKQTSNLRFTWACTCCRMHELIELQCESNSCTCFLS